MGNTVGSQRKLTKRQKDILIGMLLGDGCLEKNGRNVRLRIEHGLSQKDYLDWKYKEFHNLSTDKPRIVQSFHPKTGRYYQRWHFSTFSFPGLNIYQRKFYSQKTRKIPEDILGLLKSPLSLAVWFMDDGYKRNDCNALRINTDCFDHKGQERLQQCLKRNFKLNTRIHKKGKFWNIYIPNPVTRKFCDIINPYILPEMRYKISLTP